MPKKDMVIVVSKAKAHVKNQEVTVGLEALAVLSDQVKAKLTEAAAKALADGRKVIKPRDLE